MTQEKKIPRPLHKQELSQYKHLITQMMERARYIGNKIIVEKTNGRHDYGTISDMNRDNIEMSYDVSGCGDGYAEEEYISFPVEFLILNDNELQDAILDKVTNDNREEILRIEKRKLEESEKLKERRREEFERLKKEFEEVK